MSGSEKPPFAITTVGWELSLIQNLCDRVQSRGYVRFDHILVDTVTDRQLRGRDSHYYWLFSKEELKTLDDPDLQFLAKLEAPGLSTIHNIILGDRVLSKLPMQDALAYVSSMGKRLCALLNVQRPDAVLGSFDSAHSGIARAVCHQLDIPYFAMSFTAIPQGLMGFCTGSDPDSLAPITRPIDEEILEEAAIVRNRFVTGNANVLAYRAPVGAVARVRDMLRRIANFGRRISLQLSGRGGSRYLWPSSWMQVRDWVRRTRNYVFMPRRRMIEIPPAENYAFFALHMRPESSIDTWAPFFMDQIKVVEQVAQSMPPDLLLLVKIHFSDFDNYSPLQYHKLLSLPGVQLVNPMAASRHFLDNASLVFGIQGTICLEAALLGKPVLMFGESPYLHFPGTQRIGRITELPDQIRASRVLPEVCETDILKAFASYLARYMKGVINNWSRPLTEEEIDRLHDCFKKLAQYVRNEAAKE